MARELRTLGWDYLMFALFIAFTVFTPLWKRLFGKAKQRSKADYVFATGGISIIAVMLSIARGTLGVRTVLGYPSELYYRGSAMWEIIYGMASAYPIVCFVFVPIYFNLGITSVYQYLDLRFKSRTVRCLASATYAVRQICSLGVTVYTPSVALSTVIGIPYWASIAGMSAICVFFSIKGGLKAAINADVIQTITVIVVSLVIIIRGTIFSGGPQKVYERNHQDGRLKFLNFTGDLTVRVDTTSAWLGQLFMSLSQFGCQQNFMQRYVSLKSMNEVKRAMLSNIPVIFVFFSLSWFTGLVIYASYADCDPLAEGYIQKPDEILPFYVEDQLAFIPGFLGIFMATLFNGALCMMVSNLNSLATVIWEDFLAFIPQFKGLTDRQQLGVIKTVTAVCGFIIMGIAFSVGLLSGVIESSMLAFSATSGPLLGCFVLATLIPIANWKGTAAGMLTSCTVVLWIISGSFTIDKSAINQLLPTSTEGCDNFTFSQSIHKPTKQEFTFLPATALWEMPDRTQKHHEYFIQNDTTILQAVAEAQISNIKINQERTPLQYFYSISYMYYSLIGTALTVIIGIIVSYLTQDLKQDAYDAKLLHPLIFKLHQKLPGEKPYYVKEADGVINDEIISYNGTISNGGSRNVTGAGGGGEGNNVGGGTYNASNTKDDGDVGDGSNGHNNVNAKNNVGHIAKINHAFEPQNEVNIIIGATATATTAAAASNNYNNIHDKNKNPMDVVFTSIKTTTIAATMTTPSTMSTTTANKIIATSAQQQKDQLQVNGFRLSTAATPPSLPSPSLLLQEQQQKQQQHNHKQQQQKITSVQANNVKQHINELSCSSTSLSSTLLPVTDAKQTLASNYINTESYGPITDNVLV